MSRRRRSVRRPEGPQFLSELPAGGGYDVILAASVMLYIEGWQSVVAGLAGYGAPYLLFADMFIGVFQRYVTLRAYYGKFFNNPEFVTEVERHGHRLALRATCDVKTLDKFGPLPMDNFPAKLRIPQSSHLLFQHTGR